MIKKDDSKKTVKVIEDVLLDMLLRMDNLSDEEIEELNTLLDYDSVANILSE